MNTVPRRCHTGVPVAALLCPETEAALGEEIRAARQAAAAPPIAGADPKPRWTLRRPAGFVPERFGRRCRRETIRAGEHASEGVLRRLDLSWKQARKLPGRAEPANRLARHQSALWPDPERRAAFIKPAGPLLDGARDERHARVYLDEAHIHHDAGLGHGWGECGQRFSAAASPGLAAKVSFHGLYLHNEGQLRIWPCPRANGEHTIDVLRRLRAAIPEHKLIVLWDGAPYHRAETVWTAAASLDIHLLPLPGDSPDLMPVEALWRRVGEDVTCHHCHATAEDLIRRAAACEVERNQDAYAAADRLWVKDHLDPEEAKLRFSS
jgi:transposase